MRAEALPLLPTQTGVDEDRLPLDPACASRDGGGGGPRPAWTARIGALVAVVLVLICGAALAVYTGPGSRASLGKSSAHHSHLKSSGSGGRGGGRSHKRVAPSSSSFSSSSHSSKGGGDTKASAAVGTATTTTTTSVCQNIPADNAAGTFQFVDAKCSGGSDSVPGCVGASDCRFCHTTIVPSGARNVGWPTCPNQVCTDMKALGCKGENASSKREVLWQLARGKAIDHNDYVRGISVGKCATSSADASLGRHQFSDASCKAILGPGCVGGSSQCRFCQLSKGKQTADWVTCPDVVCKKWKIKGGGCEAPLGLVEVPPKHPTRGFDAEGEEKAQEKVLRDFLKARNAPVPAGDSGGSKDDRGGGDGLLRGKTAATGDLVVDLLQSKDRGAYGVVLQSRPSAPPAKRARVGRDETRTAGSAPSPSTSAHGHKGGSGAHARDENGDGDGSGDGDEDNFGDDFGDYFGDEGTASRRSSSKRKSSHSRRSLLSEE